MQSSVINKKPREKEAGMVEGDIRIISNSSVKQQTVTITNSGSNMMDQRGERRSTSDETLTCFQYNSC